MGDEIYEYNNYVGGHESIYQFDEIKGKSGACKQVE